MIIFFSTLISCLLFDKVNVMKTTKKLVLSYKELPFILSNKALSEDQRQRKLMDSSFFQLKNLVILCLKLSVALLPFSALFFFKFNLALLFTIKYILISLAGFAAYIAIKKGYEKALKNK